MADLTAEEQDLVDTFRQLRVLAQGVEKATLLRDAAQTVLDKATAARDSASGELWEKAHSVERDAPVDPPVDPVPVEEVLP